MKLAAICLFVVSLFTLAPAQAVVISGSAGFNADSPYNRLYNPRTVVTFKGKVTGMTVAAPIKGMGNAVSITVKATNGKTWHVDVGPEWYVNNQVTRIKVKDNVQVTGSRVNIDGQEVVLAEQIVKNRSVLALRRPAGRPYWDAVVAQMPGDPDQRVVVGQVTNIDTFVDGTNGVTQRLTIQTEDGPITVALAPQWFMERQALQVSLGQQVNVNTWAPLGTATQPAGRGVGSPIVFATAVGVGQQWMVLRTVNGRPMWIGADGG